MQDGQREVPRRVAFLLAQVGAHVADRFADRVRDLALTPSEAAVLRLVGRTPGLSQRSIADRVGTVPSRIVNVVDALERRGLVARTRSTTDRRNYELHLTDDGRTTLAALRQVAEAHETEIVAGLTDQQRQHLADALQALARSHHLDTELHSRTGVQGHTNLDAEAQSRPSC